MNLWDEIFNSSSYEVKWLKSSTGNKVSKNIWKNAQKVTRKVGQKIEHGNLHEKLHAKLYEAMYFDTYTYYFLQKNSIIRQIHPLEYMHSNS